METNGVPSGREKSLIKQWNSLVLPTQFAIAANARKRGATLAARCASMKILVTGGAGFIGSHLCDAFAADNHEVAALDNLSGGENLTPQTQLFEVDVRDADAVTRALREFRPDTVVHCAAQLDVRASVIDPAYDASINVVGGLNVLTAAQSAGATRFIFASTGGAIYGEPDQMPVPESAPKKPESPYGLSKATFENYLELTRRRGEIVPVVLRYSNVYGPRQGVGGEAGVVAVFAKKLLKGEKCTIFGDGTSARDYVYVGDIVAANRAALTRGDGEQINIGTGQLTTIEEVFAAVQGAVAANSSHGAQSAPDYVPLRAGEVDKICLDASRAREVLGWAPQVQFADGVRAAVAWLAER